MTYALRLTLIHRIGSLATVSSRPLRQWSWDSAHTMRRTRCNSALTLTPLIAALPLTFVLQVRSARAQTFSTPWMHSAQGEWATPLGVIDPRILFFPPSWGQLTGATGNWYGLRSALSERGLSFLGSYESESAGNPVGGDVHKLVYTHNLALAVALDLDRLVGLKDTYFLASASQRAGDNLSQYIPNSFQVQQLYGHQTIRLVDLAVETLMFHKRLDIVAGRVNALDDFATSPLYCYAQNLGFCGNPLSIPTNASVPSYPNTAWGIRARYEFSHELYSMTGAYNTFINFRGNKFHGVDFSIRDNSGVAIMQEFGYRPDLLRQIGYEGTFKLGGLYDSEPRLQFETGEMRGGTWQLYMTAQQRLLPLPKGATNPHQGLWGFLAFTYAPPKMNQLEYFVNGGLLYFGLIPNRPHDEIGLFGVWGGFSSDLRAAQRAMGEPTMTHEEIIEFNYMYQVTPSLSVQPDIQGVFNPNGTGLVSDTLVLGVQVTITL
jgi:porin